MTTRKKQVNNYQSFKRNHMLYRLKKSARLSKCLMTYGLSLNHFRYPDTFLYYRADSFSFTTSDTIYTPIRHSSPQIFDNQYQTCLYLNSNKEIEAEWVLCLNGKIPLDFFITGNGSFYKMIYDIKHY